MVEMIYLEPAIEEKDLQMKWEKLNSQTMTVQKSNNEEEVLVLWIRRMMYINLFSYNDLLSILLTLVIECLD